MIESQKGSILYCINLCPNNPIEFCIQYAEAGFNTDFIFKRLEFHPSLKSEQAKPSLDEIRASKGNQLKKLYTDQICRAEKKAVK